MKFYNNDEPIKVLYDQQEDGGTGQGDPPPTPPPKD